MAERDGAELDQAFELAAKCVQDYGAGLSQSDKLNIYGLYKQATIGDCNIPKPGFFDMRGRAKWGAWESLKGTDAATAKQRYIVFVQSKLSDAATSSASTTPSSNSEGDAGDDTTSEKGALGPVMSIMADAAKRTPRDCQGIWDWVSEGHTRKVADALAQDKQAVLHLRDQEGATLLHVACDRGHADVVVLLLDAGAPIDARDDDGSTPLHYAAMCGYEDVVRELLRRGADKGTENNDKETPADTADAAVAPLLT